MANDNLVAAKVRLRRTLWVLGLVVCNGLLQAANCVLHCVSTVVAALIAFAVLIVALVNGVAMYRHRDDWKRVRDARLALSSKESHHA